MEKNPSFYSRYLNIDNSEAFFNYMLKPIKPSVRINTLKADMDEVVERLSEDFELDNIKWCKVGFS